MSDWTVAGCLATKDGKSFRSGLEVVEATRGACWWWGVPHFTGFVTCLPPNSPNCVQYAANWWEEHGHGVLGANSNHTGGINVALADGSVQFVSSTVDSGTLQSISAGEGHSGQSPWGVWGALGSINGGESKGL